MPTEVLLMRHGQSEWNAIGRWQGQADSPLTDLGRAQAVADYERAHKNRPEVIRSAIVPARFVLSTAGR